MKFEGFKLIVKKNQQIIEIDCLGEIFDLHNAAEFLKIEYLVETRALILFWKYYFYEKETVPIQIKFDGVNSFEIFPRDVEMPKEEDDCLEEIIYDRNIEFRFMGGMKIFINADSVSFKKLI